MWQTIGQPKAIALLGGSLRAGTLAHAYLFVGPPHVGKTTLALDLAKALNCQGPDVPCGACVSCRRTSEGKHSDVRLISFNPVGPDGKPRQTIGIEEIRLDILRSAALPPYEGKRKVYIFEAAEYLTAEAANCLLKALEEPLPHVVWLLVTSEESRLLETVVSRCQRIELRPMPVAEVAKALREQRGVEPARAELLARLSEGCIGWAFTALQDSTVLERRKQVLDKLVSLLSQGVEERFAWAAELAAGMERDRRFGTDVLKAWLGWWRDLMMVKNSCPDAVVNIDYGDALVAYAKTFTAAQVKACLDGVRAALYEISRNVTPRLALEVLVLNMVTPAATTAPANPGARP